jgi:hypothetical protein
MSDAKDLNDDYLTIEYQLDAESQFIEAAEKSGAMVISSVQEF